MIPLWAPVAGVNWWCGGSGGSGSGGGGGGGGSGGGGGGGGGGVVVVWGWCSGVRVACRGNILVIVVVLAVKFFSCDFYY